MKYCYTESFLQLPSIVSTSRNSSGPLLARTLAHQKYILIHPQFYHMTYFFITIVHFICNLSYQISTIFSSHFVKLLSNFHQISTSNNHCLTYASHSSSCLPLANQNLAPSSIIIPHFLTSILQYMKHPHIFP